MLITYKITIRKLGILLMIFILQGCLLKTSENPQSNNDDTKKPTINKIISIGKFIYIITSLFSIISQKCTFFDNIYKYRSEDLTMKKLKMARSVTLTFEEGCNKYLENCEELNRLENKFTKKPLFYVKKVI